MAQINRESEIARMLLRRQQDIIPVQALDTIIIEECGEPLVNITDAVPGVAVQFTQERERFEGEQAYLRQSVAEALGQVQESLRGHGLGLLIWDAFRPIEYQQAKWDETCNNLQLQYPSWSTEQVRRQAELVIYPPSWDPQRPPPHSTGAAVDLTIVNRAGKPLDMGTGYCEFTSSMICTNSEGLTANQLENRRHLVTGMGRAGFINYPGEWWHFSLGDRVAAAYLGEPTARFGRANDPYAGRPNQKTP